MNRTGGPPPQVPSEAFPDLLHDATTDDSFKFSEFAPLQTTAGDGTGALVSDAGSHSDLLKSSAFDDDSFGADVVLARHHALMDGVEELVSAAHAVSVRRPLGVGRRSGRWRLSTRFGVAQFVHSHSDPGRFRKRSRVSFRPHLGGHGCRDELLDLELRYSRDLRSGDLVCRQVGKPDSCHRRVRRAVPSPIGSMPVPDGRPRKRTP